MQAGPDHRRSGFYAALLFALLVTAVAVVRGPVRYLHAGGGPWVEILPVSFEYWDQHHIGQHYFLSFSRAEDVARGFAYTHYSQPWLLLLYALLQPLRWSGVSYHGAQPWLCVPQLAAVIALLAGHLRTMGGAALWPLLSLQQVRLAGIALAVACVTTVPSLWVPYFRFNPEQTGFVPAIAFCHLAAADYQRPVGRPSDWLALLAIALFAPIFAPFAIVSWLLLWETDGTTQGRATAGGLLGIAAIAAIAALAFLLPGWLIHFTAFSAGGSSFSYRSGLDGSQEFFSSMLQAVLAPSYAPGRPWYLLHWPVIALSAVMLAAIRSRHTAARMLRQLLISWLPFLWMVVVFPQWVSIHPYCSDIPLALGSAFCLAFWLQRPELAEWTHSPPLRLAIVIVLVALLMTNLIDLARVAGRPA